VTDALAAGRSEGWISDRTGHNSSAMINRHCRRARNMVEAGLGLLTPLDRPIPERAAAFTAANAEQMWKS
jgi:hypothetical protein